MPIIQGQSPGVPSTAKAAFITVSGTATGGGTPNYELELESCQVTSGNQGMSSAVIRREYGTGKYPHQSSLALRSPLVGMIGKWISITFSNAAGQAETQFRGVIVQEANTLHGSDGSAPTGVQRWHCRGPLHLLRKVTVSRSYWLEGVGLTATVTMDTVPSFNERDELGTLAGNRSAVENGGTYLFGGSDLWTRAQAVAYLLGRFGPAGVSWQITGDRQLLDAATDAIGMGQSGTLENALNRIISPQFGLDYVVRPYSSGFAIHVFSLSAQSVTFGGTTLPANQRKVSAVAGGSAETRMVEFMREESQRYSRIRVIGERAVACFTLRASAGQLVAKWDAATEAAYLAGTGTSADSGALHDEARRRPRLASVFTTYGAPQPFALGSVGAGVGVSSTGGIDSYASSHQSIRRSTLAWLPLRAGHTYASGSEVAEVASNHEADLQRPMAWILDPSTSRYVRVEELGLGLAVPWNDWGIILQGADPHILALNHWAGAEATEAPPVYDWETMVATIAIQTDVRMAIEASVDDGADAGSVLEINVPGAELWFAAPGTVVGTTGAGALETITDAIELRNDASRLSAVMAGAVARYLRSRARATVVMQGYQPWASALGAIMTDVRLGGIAEDVGAPVTSVSYEGAESPMTRVRAGYRR